MSLLVLIDYTSRVISKPAKPKTPISCAVNCTAHRRLCLHFTDCTIPLVHKFENCTLLAFFHELKCSFESDLNFRNTDFCTTCLNYVVDVLHLYTVYQTLYTALGKIVVPLAVCMSVCHFLDVHAKGRSVGSICQCSHYENTPM